jgi:hypothetical protein
MVGPFEERLSGSAAILAFTGDQVDSQMSFGRPADPAAPTPQYRRDQQGEDEDRPGDLVPLRHCGHRSLLLPKTGPVHISRRRIPGSKMSQRVTFTRVPLALARVGLSH